MKIDIMNNAWAIGGKPMNFPLPIGEIKKIWGEARFTKTTYNQIYTWDDIGICCYAENGEEVESIELFIQPSAYDFAPGNTFNTAFLIENCSYEDYYYQNVTHLKKTSKKLESGSFVVGDVSIYYYIKGK